MKTLKYSAAAACLALVLAACSGTSEPAPTVTITETASAEPAPTVTVTETTAPTEPEVSEEDLLKAAVADYTEAFFTDGEKAWNLLSEKCQADRPLLPFEIVVDQAKEQYPNGAEIETITVTVDGDKATATYSLSASELNQTNESWIKEDGQWKYNHC